MRPSGPPSTNGARVGSCRIQGLATAHPLEGSVRPAGGLGATTPATPVSQDLAALLVGLVAGRCQQVEQCAHTEPGLGQGLSQVPEAMR